MRFALLLLEELHFQEPSEIEESEPHLKAGLASGLRLLSIALLVYAASAFLSSASAGAWLLAVYTPELDPSGTLANVGGSLFLAAGVFLAIVTLALLVVSFRRLEKGLDKIDSPRDWYAAPFSTFRRYPFYLLAITLLLSPLLAVKGGYSAFIGLFSAISGATALTFLAILVLPALALEGPPPWTLTLGALVVGAGAAVGLALVTPLPIPPTRVDWLTLGGFPLLNWNLPFGSAVGVSALLLWSAYRSIARRPLGGQGSTDTGPH